MKAKYFRLMAVLSLFCFITPVSSAASQVYKCQINGKTVYRDYPCPGSLDTEQKEKERRATKREEEAAKKAAEREAQRQAEHERSQAEEERVKRRVNSSRSKVAKESEPVDCTNLYSWARAKGQNFFEAGETVSNARRKGLCVDKQE